MTGWRAEIVAAAALSGAFLLLLAAAETWARRFRGKPEWTRKLVHLAGGALTLLFPFFLKSPWTVLVIACALCGLFAAGQRWGFLKSLNAVSRKTRGGEYYPFSIFLVFLLAHDRLWLYFAAILVLAAADAFAALIGTRYGRLKYEVEDDQKSLEGSLAFFFIALLAVILPMRLLADFPMTVILPSAFLMAVLVTAFEAISLDGRDNLFVPLAVLFILDKITAKPPGEIEWQVGGMVAIFAGVALLAWRTRTFNVAGALVLILFAYGAWSLGSWQWALPVFLGLTLYVLLRFIASAGRDFVQQARVKVLSRALLPAFAVVALANGLSKYEFFYGPYMAACVAILAFSLWKYVLWRWTVPASRRLAGAALSAAVAWALMAILPWQLQKAGLSALAAALSVGVLIALVNDRLIGAAPSFERERLWPASQFILVALSAALIVLMQSWRWIPLWRPA